MVAKSLLRRLYHPSPAASERVGFAIAVIGVLTAVVYGALVLTGNAEAGIGR